MGFKNTLASVLGEQKKQKTNFLSLVMELFMIKMTRFWFRI
jgi:hypothetical protein